MKVYKILYILSIVLIVLTGSTFISCESDDTVHKIKDINTNIIPDILEGDYYSPNFPSSVISITEEEIIMDFSPYKEKIIQFYTQDVDYTSTDKSFTIHYYDKVNIKIEYILNSRDVTIVYDDAGVLYELGQYSYIE